MKRMYVEILNGEDEEWRFCIRLFSFFTFIFFFMTISDTNCWLRLFTLYIYVFGPSHQNLQQNVGPNQRPYRRTYTSRLTPNHQLYGSQERSILEEHVFNCCCSSHQQRGAAECMERLADADTKTIPYFRSPRKTKA